MSRLNWNNVATPDFTSAALLQRNASQAIDGALTGVGDFVTGMATRNNAANEKQLELRRLEYLKDPQRLRDDLASGQFFGNVKPENLSSSYISGLATVSDGMLDSQTKFRTDGRAEDERVLTEAARPIQNQITALRAQGKNAEADALATQSPQLQALQAKDFESLVQSGNTQGVNYRTEQSGRAEYALGQELEKVRANLGINNITAESKLRDLDAAYMAGEISPAAYNKATGELRAEGGGVAEGGGGAVGGGGMPSGGSGLTNVGDGIPFPETKDYVQKVLGYAGSIPQNISNREKAEYLRDAVIKQESAGNPNAVSRKGALGLMQIIPSTGQRPGLGVKPLQNNSPEENVRFGVDYLEALLNRYDGNAEAALAAYNGGHTNADKWFGPNGSATKKPRDQIRETQLIADDANNAVWSAVGDNRRFNELQANPASQPELVASAIGEGGLFAGVDRGALNTAFNEIKAMVPQIEGVSKDSIKNSNFRPSPAQILDVLSTSQNAGVDSSIGIGLTGLKNAASWVLGGDKVKRVEYSKDTAQQRINELYKTHTQGSSQYGRDLTQKTAEQAQLAQQVQQAKATVQALAGQANTPGRERELNRARQQLATAEALLDASNTDVQGSSIKVSRPDALEAEKAANKPPENIEEKYQNMPAPLPADLQKRANPMLRWLYENGMLSVDEVQKSSRR